MIVRLDLEVHDRVLVGVAWFSGLCAAAENPFWDEMESLAATLRRAHAGLLPGDIKGLEPARRLYHRFGIDPTRTRPSSEALLRRVLKGESLYRLNRLVDAINWASLAMLLPIGLYDLTQDPAEKTDLLADPARSAPVVSRFKAFRRQLRAVAAR